MLFALVAQTDLTFVRHGETLANVSGVYNSRTIDTFSPKGQQQVAALTRVLLAEPRFDAILVSPSPRAMRTIAPYLRASGQTAIVWPLLYECCTGRKAAGPPTPLRYGGKIVIPPDLRDVLQPGPWTNRYPASPDYASGLGQVQASLTEFMLLVRSRRVLLVGHSGHGGHLLYALTGKWTKVDNASPIRITLP